VAGADGVVAEHADEQDQEDDGEQRGGEHALTVAPEGGQVVADLVGDQIQRAVAAARGAALAASG